MSTGVGDLLLRLATLWCTGARAPQDKDVIKDELSVSNCSKRRARYCPADVEEFG